MTHDARKPRRPTQADVARLSNVSQAMVSYVLNNKRSVAVPPQTRQRILDAIDHLGYVPNRAARSLRTRTTHTIASIIPDITNPFYPAFERGLQDVAERHGYEVIVYNTDGVATKEFTCLTSIQQGRVDGVVATFFHVTTAHVRTLIERGISVVCLEPCARHVEGLPLDEIHVDNAAAACTAVSYLIARGRRRIGLIAGRQSGGPLRGQGYRQALTQHQIAVDEDLVRYADFGTQDEQDGYHCMTDLLRLTPPLDAVFACNDLMALGALLALRDRHVRVPQDVAVVGFDDIPAAHLVSPALTTVTMFQERLGARAAEMLLERLAGTAPAAGRSVQMPYHLVVRESA